MSTDRFRCRRQAVSVLTLAAVVVIGGCQSPGAGGRATAGRNTPARDLVRRVRCVYDQNPWINVDRLGDRDPEGVRFRVFLDRGTGTGVLHDGTFHVEMYQVERSQQGKKSRRLVSDWHYPTSRVATIAKPGMLGRGYYLQLVWASKDIAGKNVEMIVFFEDSQGNIARSETKSFRVPKYTS